MQHVTSLRNLGDSGREGGCREPCEGWGGPIRRPGVWRCLRFGGRGQGCLGRESGPHGPHYSISHPPSCYVNFLSKASLLKEGAPGAPQPSPPENDPQVPSLKHVASAS